MNTLTARYEEGLHEALRNPVEAAAYLNAALDEGDMDGFLLALRDVAETRGIAQTARAANLNRENLYRILAADGNPQLSSLNALLRSMNLRLAIEVQQ